MDNEFKPAQQESTSEAISSAQENFELRRRRNGGQEYKGTEIRPNLEVEKADGIAQAYGGVLIGPEVFLAEIAARPGMTKEEVRELAIDYRDKDTDPSDLIDIPTYSEYLIRRVVDGVQNESRRSDDGGELQAQRVGRQLLGIMIRSDKSWAKLEKIDELVLKLRDQINRFEFEPAELTLAELKRAYSKKVSEDDVKIKSPFGDPEVRRILDIPEDL